MDKRRIQRGHPGRHAGLATQGVFSDIAGTMSTLEAKVPDLLFQQVQELAHKQKVTVDQLVSSALAAQVSAHSTRESAASRARRVHWPKVDEILARVPDVPPPPGDEM